MAILDYFPKTKRGLLFTTLLAALTIPVLIWGLSQSQETRKQAQDTQAFPQVDLNGDGVINNLDLKIYLEKFATTKPSK